MITAGTDLKVLVATRPVDFRKQADGLAAIVQVALGANPFSGAQESLPLFIYRFVRTQSEADIQRGYAGALVLLVLILSLFVVARIIGRDRSVASRRRARVRPARQPSLLLSTAPRRLTKPAQTLRSIRPAPTARSMRPAQGSP